MATEQEIINWYNSFAINAIKEQLGINLNHPKDAERLRVPSLDGNSTRPLFEKGFQNNADSRRQLYEYAKNGKLFAFSKKDNQPYQITEKTVNSCNQSKEQEKEKVSTAKKFGYGLVSLVWAPVRFTIGLMGRVFNLLTLGIFEKPVRALGRGLDAMTGAWSERLFSVSRQKKEKEKKVSLLERAGNKLTLGSYKKDKIEAHDKEKEYNENREKMKNVLNSESNFWKKQNDKEKEQKVQEKTQAKINNAIENTKQKINEIQQPEKKTEVDNDKPLQDSGKEMKSKLKMQYEAMRMAFGPGGEGFTEAINIARDMNVLIEKMTKDPELLKNSGLNPDKLKEFSNMCTNMEKIGKEGLNAKKELMITEECSKLTAQEKEQRICQLQLMNMVEKAMVNSAYSSYLDNQGQLEKMGTNMKSSRLFNAMHKDPAVFEHELYRGIKQLESTEKLKEMSPEEIAEYISEPERIRKTYSKEPVNKPEEVKVQHRDIQKVNNYTDPIKEGVQVYT